jgi:hypothetical protein
MNNWQFGLYIRQALHKIEDIYFKKYSISLK